MRSEGDFIKINEWLLPLSWIYGTVTSLRNWLFDVGILKSRAYKIPVIAVGNITVGGTGKTPHVEYLVNLLQDKIKVGVLSRGYKRKSKGYVLAHPDTTTVREIGDEPYQMMQKFPKTYIAVDKNRREGIERLTTDEASNDVDVILLDDAYQHRYVKPGINILLVDYHRLIIYDKLLPAGRLRESLKGKNRADMVVITKCPRDLKPMEYRVLTKALDLYPYQGLYFTTLEYGELKPLFPKKTEPREPVGQNLEFQFEESPPNLKAQNVLLLTGIASPEQITEDLRGKCKEIVPLTFSDHHHFKPKDIRRINEAFASLPEPRIVVTTEKDAARLHKAEGLSDEVRQSIYTQPIRIKFMLEQENNFNQKILSYVQKNSRNSILAQPKDALKPKDRHHPGERTRRISFRDN